MLFFTISIFKQVFRKKINVQIVVNFSEIDWVDLGVLSVIQFWQYSCIITDICYNLYERI